MSIYKKCRLWLLRNFGFVYKELKYWSISCLKLILKLKFTFMCIAMCFLVMSPFHMRTMAMVQNLLFGMQHVDYVREKQKYNYEARSSSLYESITLSNYIFWVTSISYSPFIPWLALVTMWTNYMQGCLQHLVSSQESVLLNLYCHWV